MFCKHCDWLEKNFPIQNNREYWLFIQVFIYLHDGKDYCEIGSKLNKLTVEPELSDDEYHQMS